MQETKESHDKLSARSNVNISDEEEVGRTSSRSHALREVEVCPPASGSSHRDISVNRRNQMRTAVKNDLDLPGRLGWVRVCVVTGQDKDISNVLYYSPKDKKTGKSVKFKSLRYVVRHLEETGCRELVSSNFNFARKTLGLGAPGEVWRKTLCPAPFSVIPSDYSLYLQFFIDSVEVDSRRFHSDGTLRKNRNISCTLCPGGLLITATHVTDHMRKVHLPAEACRNCGEEVEAVQAGLHTRECKGGEGRKLHGTGGEVIIPSTIKVEEIKSKELIKQKVNDTSICQS